MLRRKYNKLVLVNVQFELINTFFSSYFKDGNKRSFVKKNNLSGKLLGESLKYNLYLMYNIKTELFSTHPKPISFQTNNLDDSIIFDKIIVIYFDYVPVRVINILTPLDKHTWTTPVTL